MAIARCLVDTNILLRMTRRLDPQHKVVAAALGSTLGCFGTATKSRQPVSGEIISISALQCGLYQALSRFRAKESFDCP
jgi:hypothetical protein